eukprot:CAMPEP_0197861294 /NCGR_PEP_ID=MMETSP1438-20131217/37247_1 /TAXON_ID=1461541 /ORGANISM="Pterosperma sp., Strain CCMP1384" /LENGTH=119 /DNA_ID=CAMNT_0043478423 /DNA_START=111 /DNA_END=467 /DNA_ORIENTATION=+
MKGSEHRLTKTASKSQYRLNDRDLESLDFVSKKNKYGGTTMLYKEEDVKSLAIRKHGSLEALQVQLADVSAKRRRKGEIQEAKEVQRAVEHLNSNQSHSSSSLTICGIQLPQILAERTH